MCWRVHDGTALVDQSLEPEIKMKTTLTMVAICEMLLHRRDFLGIEFPVNIKMETSNRLNTMHIKLSPALARVLSVHSNIIRGTFIPNIIAIYCKEIGRFLTIAPTIEE